MSKETLNKYSIQPTYACAKKVIKHIVDSPINDAKALRAYAIECLQRMEELEPKLKEKYIFGLISRKSYRKNNPDYYQIFFSDTETWKEGCMLEYTPEEIAEIMFENNFTEAMEAVFEPCHNEINLSKCELIDRLKKLGFEYNEEFEKKMQEYENE
jgi:hypothetical protein